jgi:2-polyprenyl-3-methyl-5-hydroxy-6-metoxy-1,4-benzoquinol methylase
MQPETIARLNTINRDFYATIASDFSATRGRAWQGWLDLLPYLPQRPLRVLDVGCGNGRWGVHLAENERLAHYHGIDNNPTLLAHAQDALMQTGISAQFNEHDAIIDAGANLAQVTQDATYDVVGVFGVLHHVPSSQYRLAFMQALAQCVAQGGLLVVATWRFGILSVFGHDTYLGKRMMPNKVRNWHQKSRGAIICSIGDGANAPYVIAIIPMMPSKTRYAKRQA